MTIVWTKDALAELTPRRGEAKPPNLAYDEAKLAALVIDEIDATRPKYEAGFQQKDLGDPSLVRRVFAYYKQFEADFPLDSVLQGATLRIASGVGDSGRELVRDVVRRWIVRGGLVFAVRCIYEYAVTKVVFGKAQVQHGTIIQRDLDIASIGRDEEHGWSLFGLRADELREDLATAILAANDADYAAVVAVIGELRKTAFALVRADLTSLVPTELAWAQKDATDVLAQKRELQSLSTVKWLFPVLGNCAESKQLFAVLAPERFTLGARVYDAVRALGDDAIPPLARAMAGYETERPKANIDLPKAKHIARALALFDDERAMKAFLPWIGDAKTLGPVAVEFMQRNPTLATHGLAPRLLEKTKGAEPAQQLLARIARSHPNEVREAAKDLAKDQRAAVEKLCGDGPTATAKVEVRGPAASVTDLPEVLANPPWRRKGARPTLPTVSTFKTLAYEERVVWSSETERNAATKPPFGGTAKNDLETIRSKIETLVAAKKENTPFWLKPGVAWFATEDSKELLALWNESPVWARNVSESSFFSEVACMLARFGVEAIPGAIASATHTGYDTPFAALMRCDSPRVAHAALRGLGRGALRKYALAWIAAFPDAALIGLLPIALGPATRDKPLAASALSQHVDHARVRSIAARFGKEVADATEAMLAFDPMFECPKAAPKLSAFADPASLPALLMADGRAAPGGAKEALLEMLQFTPLDPPYAGIAQVQHTFEATSVDELLRTLLAAWVAAGAASASAWALRAIGHMGSDAMARELSAKIRKWPREKGRPRALLGLDVLGRMGTDVALMHLFDLSKTAKNRHIEARAKEVLDAAASSRGLTGDALEDRLVPTLDLASDGSTTLDFGARQLTLRVDEHLDVHMYDGTTRLTTSPRATKQDDAAKAKDAIARYKTIKSELETIKKTQLWRFEHAMIAKRTWRADEHRALLVDHPLAGRVARKLVWAVWTGDTIAASFRVAEDGTLATDADAPFTAPQGARIGIPHALQIEPALSKRWSSIFADYKIIQPFDQLTRATFTVDGKQRGKKSIETFAGREIPYGVVFGRLESRGWRRGSIDDGSISTLEKDFGAISATLMFSPPIFMREKPPSDVTIESVDFGVLLGEVPAIAYSEAMFDLSVFGAK